MKGKSKQFHKWEWARGPAEGGGGGEWVLTLLLCGLPGFIRVDWPPWTDLPFCKAIIFWCCCSVKAVKAFKCFKVNSKTTAFSRCPSVCIGAKENGALGYLKNTHLAWLALHSAQRLKQTLFLYFLRFPQDRLYMISPLQLWAPTPEFVGNSTL